MPTSRLACFSAMAAVVVGRGALADTTFEILETRFYTYFDFVVDAAGQSREITNGGVTGNYPDALTYGIEEEGLYASIYYDNYFATSGNGASMDLYAQSSAYFLVEPGVDIEACSAATVSDLDVVFRLDQRTLIFSQLYGMAQDNSVTSGSITNELTGETLFAFDAQAGSANTGDLEEARRYWEAGTYRLHLRFDSFVGLYTPGTAQSNGSAAAYLAIIPAPPAWLAFGAVAPLATRRRRSA